MTFEIFSKLNMKRKSEISPSNTADEIQTNSNNNDDDFSRTEKKKKIKKSKEEFKEELIELLKDCGFRSSCHGLPSLTVVDVHICVKIIWVLVVLTSWSYFIYLISTIVNNYRSYGVISSLSIAYEAPTNFPAIVFCNLNPYNGFQARNFIVSVLADKNISISDYGSYYDYTTAASSQYKADVEYAFYNDTTDGSIYDVGEVLTNTLISCQYQGKNCNASNFYSFHDYEYGNCFRFNGLDPSTNYSDYSYTQASSLYQTRKPGDQYGLVVELYAGDQYNQSQFVTSTGFKVLVHNQTVIPFPAEEGILATVGQQTNVAIYRRFVNHLGQPYSNCIDTLSQSSSSANQILGIMYQQLQSGQILTYQQSYCLKVCYFMYSTNLCSCFDLSLTFLNITTSQRPCESVDDVECLNKAEKDFYTSNVSDNCLVECPTECSEVEYDLTVSNAAYPNNWYAQLFNEPNRTFSLNTRFYNTNNITAALIQSTTLLINVYYDSLYFDVITETPAMTFDTLLAAIGGNLGLFTGASLLTFMEFIELLVSGVIIYYAHRKLRHHSTNHTGGQQHHQQNDANENNQDQTSMNNNNHHEKKTSVQHQHDHEHINSQQNNEASLRNSPSPSPSPSPSGDSIRSIP